jgi:hypothetical protein
MGLTRGDKVYVVYLGWPTNNVDDRSPFSSLCFFYFKFLDIMDGFDEG